ncbi:MAG: O-methyltransferase [Chloroflexi bacterium]|nr:O-methyltransferase [Chloroflexota bacterium]
MPIYNEAIENYVRKTFAVEDEILSTIRSEIPRRGLPEITVRPEEGRFLQFLVAASGARLALEIGTLGGYSGVWIARGLPTGGKLITLELSEEHAAVAADHFEMAGVTDKVEMRVGDAHELLQDLAYEGPFDFVFIDAEKEGYPAYLDWAETNLRPRGMIAGHNAFVHGAIVDSADRDPRAVAVRRFNERLADDERFISVVFPAGDGTAVAVLRKAA